MRNFTLYTFTRYVPYIAVIVCLFFQFFPIHSSSQENMAFPGAMGWGGETRGAWGHPTIDPVILKVTNLSNDEEEEGSLFWALSQEYPRIIVFEVGGVIDMQWKRYGSIHGRNRNGQFDINNPYVTIAGQTAPSPGITIIRGGLWFWTHDVIVQHIAIRPGANPIPIDNDPNDPERHNWSNQMDALTMRGNQSDIIVDHCSFTWGNRYTVSVVGHDGADRITFSNNIVGEAIRNAYKGVLDERMSGGGVGGIFDNVRDIAIVKNLWAYNYHRNPHLTSSRGVYANNFISGNSISMTYGVPDVSFVGNYGVWGNYPLSLPGRRMYQLRSTSQPRIYFDDNTLYNYDWMTQLTPVWNITGTASSGGGEIMFLEEKEQWHDTIELVSAENLLDYLENHVGPRPWDRDAIDQGIISKVINGTGIIPAAYVPDWDINTSYSLKNVVNHNGSRYIAVSSNSGIEPGTDPDIWVELWPENEDWDESWYPDHEPTYREFNPDEWDLKYMIPHAGYWEAPELNSPENNAVDIGQNPTFTWDALDHLTYFTFQLATDEEFSEIVVDETDISGSSYTVNDLDGSTAYFWRVRGHNATGPSQWSEIRQFHTDNVPNAPVLLSPDNRSASISDSALLEWETSDNAESYSIQVSVDSNFSTIVAEEDDITQTEYEVTNLEAPATYYWRVRAHNSSGSSAWSDAWEFLLEPEPETGSLEIHLNSGWNQISSYIAPENPEIEQVFAGIAENLVLVKNDNTGVYWPEIEINEIGEWNPLHGYQVYVEDGDILEFTGTQLLPEQHPINLQQGWNQIAYLRTTPMNIEDALAGIDHEIEIVSNNAGDVYWPEYDINSLVVMEPGQGYKISVTEDVTLIYPVNDEGEPPQKIAETLVSQSASEHSNRPRKYNIAFGNTGDFAILLLLSSDLADGDEVGVWSPSNDLIGSGVAQNGKALVTVWGRNPVMNDGQHINGAVNGDALRLTQWSMHEQREYPVTITQVRDRAHNQFTNALLRYQSDAVWIVDAEALNDIPARYTLEQNYPNPFNPTTTIRYGIPEPVRVRLEVYNTIGQRIKVLVDEEKPAGYHQVIFDASDLSSGVYFYRLQAGNFTTMKRAVLIR